MNGCRKTKIVATLGPASQKPEQLRLLADAGLNVARLNFSHGQAEEHLRVIDDIRRLSRELGREIGILQDLAGPKIRLGQIADTSLTAGSLVRLSVGSQQEDESLPVNYPYLLEDLAVGERVLMADGRVELKVKAKEGAFVLCEVVTGGVLSSHKGVNLPHSELRIAAFTDKDRADLAAGLKAGVDFVAMSFVRGAKDLAPLREMIELSEQPPLLIAKIEKPQAVANIEEILQAADGIMVARGDLGVEMPIEEVPLTQKKLIQAARRRGKLVITATQMLGSMTYNPRPSRAEVTDVANAILDGTDAVMLSEETAVGSYPAEAVAMLDKVARQTEPAINYKAFWAEEPDPSLEALPCGLTRAVALMAHDIGSKVIVAATHSGSTARLLSRLRQPAAVIGLSSELRTYRQLSLAWGVVPALIQSCDSITLLEKLASRWLLENRAAEPGERVFLTCGLPLQTAGNTNLIKVLELGSHAEDGEGSGAV